MPASPKAPARRTALFGRRNLILLGAATLAVTAGYAILAAGQPSTAAVLLVAGYCVLFPLGIAL